MNDVFIEFESEGREGIVAVGTYLMDAALRLGVQVNDECRKGEESHHCSMKVSAGANLLSEPTEAEREALSEAARKAGERLACQARIERAGEIKIMSVEKPAEEKAEEKSQRKEKTEEFRKEFEEMPLDKKIASLVELEAIALGETFSYVLNSPYEAAGKVIDTLAHFGWKKDQADHEAKKPKEHAEKKAEKKTSGTAGSTKKTRAARKKKSPQNGKEQKKEG